jgi:hypothetical protein
MAIFLVSSFSTKSGRTRNIAGTGDYNNDFKADILWRNNSGLTYTWQMDGLTKLSDGAIRQVDNNWQIASPVN